MANIADDSTVQSSTCMANIADDSSVSQADVQRFEPHLGHNWLSLRCVS